MTGTACLGYAISQWKPNFDDFTRREQHVRALKVVAACVHRSGAAGRDTAAEGWNQAGAATAALGVTVSLHPGCLSAAADPETLDTLLGATDPALVGLTLDTAELILAGLDPVAVYRQYRHRVDHIHLKDTRYVDEPGERRQPYAEAVMLQAGGARGVDRWFYECGTPGGLVDFPALLRELRADRYPGWLVFESEQTPNPARSVMLNGWYARQVLSC